MVDRTPLPAGRTENENVALSAFDDRSKRPAASDLEASLGRTTAHWDDLIAHLAATYTPLDQSWNFAGPKWGWSLRLKQRKRTILYMTPLEGHFLVGFALGEKAVEAAHRSDLPDAVLAVIDEARRYVEGRAVRIEVRTRKDLESTKSLAAVKMES